MASNINISEQVRNIVKSLIERNQYKIVILLYQKEDLLQVFLKPFLFMKLQANNDRVLDVNIHVVYRPTHLEAYFYIRLGNLDHISFVTKSDILISSLL